MIGRLQQTADFERLLAAPTRQRSAHFALHYVRGQPKPAAKPDGQRKSIELSTDVGVPMPEPVDDSPSSCWLGCMVPKRHAKRSVTRSLLKRQIRAAAERHRERLAPGLWLVRLRSPFPVSHYPSAHSGALRLAARQELDHLLGHARAPT